MLTMYDSVTVADLPAGADAYAGYVNGRYANVAAVKAQFPGKPVVSIAVNTSADADCLDIEPGDAKPGDAPTWVKRQLARGVDRPIVYSSQSQMPAVLAALAAAGVSRPQVRVWSAHYTVQHLCSPSACKAGFTADATQWADHGQIGNGHYDQTTFTPAFLSAPSPSAPTPKEADMYLIDNTVGLTDVNKGEISILGPEGRRHLTGPEVSAYANSGVESKHLTNADYQAVRVIPDAPAAVASTAVTGTLTLTPVVAK